MKLRPRNKMPPNDSSAVAATVPVLPPDFTRMQTPPVSELSNAGSTTVRKERLSDLSSSVVDVSDMEETMESMSPTKNRPRPKITVPAAPLTKNNLERFQEEITSAVDVASEDESSSPTPSSHTRLVQARNFLLAENRDTCPGFTTRLEQIDDYLRKIPEEVRGLHSSIYHEVKDLLRSHVIHIIAGEEVPTRRRPPVTAKQAPLPAEEEEEEEESNDDESSQEHADPSEWTNKIDDLVDSIRRNPSARNPSFATSHVRELARPLNADRSPSTAEAKRPLNESVSKEKNNSEDKPSTMNIDDEYLWTIPHDFPPDHEESGDEEEIEYEEAEEEEGERRMRLGQGRMMPKEVRDFDWGRDWEMLDDGDEDEERVGTGNGEEEEEERAELLLAETPFLQMLMAEQIRSDLENGTFLSLFCSAVCGKRRVSECES